MGEGLFSKSNEWIVVWVKNLRRAAKAVRMNIELVAICPMRHSMTGIYSWSVAVRLDAQTGGHQFVVSVNVTKCNAMVKR